MELELSGVGAGSGDARWVELGSALHVGLLDSLEGGFAVVYGFSPDQGESAMHDPWVDLKWRLFDGRRWVPSLALSAQYKPPQRANGESTGNDACLDLVGSVFLDRIAMHANVGAVSMAVGTEENAWLLRTAAAAVFEGPRGVAAGLDVSVDSSDEGLASAVSTAGLLWEPVPLRVLSVGAGPNWQEGYPAGWQATVAWTAGFEG